MSRDGVHPGPTVVFVDDAPWECFFQLAVILRRAGIRTVRISVGLSKWDVNQILFDRHVLLSMPPTPEELATILSSEYITDVQPTESLAIVTYSALNLLSPSQRSDIWLRRTAFLDKWDVARTLRNFGVRTPDGLLAELTTPTEAVRQLSLPIVLKRRVGSSGSGVEVFHSLESLETFLVSVEILSDWFYERFVDGQSFVCATCAGDEGLDVIASYEILQRFKSHGSSVFIEILNDPRIIESGGKLVTAMALHGLACFDIIRDHNDVDWIHDVNPRAFGSLMTCQLAGFDFCGAYVHYLTKQGKFEESRINVSKGEAFVFPYGVTNLIQSEKTRTAWFRTLRWTWEHWRLLGSRYFLTLAFRVTASEVLKYWKRVRFGSSLSDISG